MEPQANLTIEAVLQLMLYHSSQIERTDIAQWPPDVFAVAGYLLNSTGLYRRAVCNEWNRTIKPVREKKLVAIGADWRIQSAKRHEPPLRVRRSWDMVLQAAEKGLMVRQIENSRPLVQALFDLVAMADVASKGMGFPHDVEVKDADYDLLAMADERLAVSGFVDSGGSSLCKHIDPDVVSVLPKVRTPQLGLTFRSLTHYLALLPKDEIKPLWHLYASAQPETDQFKLLLVPIPENISDEQFVATKSTQAGQNKLPDDFRCFGFNVESRRKWLKNEFRQILKKAREKATDHILNGVVFPELSLASPEEFVVAYQTVQEECPLAFLVAGVNKSPEHPDEESSNCVYYAAPLVGANGDSTDFQTTRHVMCQQYKHHKWCITKNQIRDYEIGTRLAPGKIWWEHINIKERQMNFFAHKSWLAFGFIICEDLARQEPASRLLRAIGPNLLIALLMDGEQVLSRWPARYATVLAEDPGCSVLTLTSLGMAKRGAKVFREKNHFKKREKRAPYTIAMWRDSEGTHPITMGENSSAILLTSTKKKITEYSIDGRTSEVVALVIDNERQNILEIKAPK